MKKIFLSLLLLSLSLFASEQKGDDSSAKANFAFGVDSVQIQDTMWTRIHFKPEIPIWKFGFAFDVELFINGEGKFDNKGWDFNTPQSTFESISRKIYYIRYNQKNKILKGDDHLYFKVGALDKTTLGWGLIMKDYCNTLYYPEEKDLGLEFILGNISPLKLGMHLVLNDFNDLSTDGAVFGGQLFFSPFGKSESPILSKTKISFNYVADFNQYSQLKDSDGDSVPDEFDLYPTDKNKSSQFDKDYDSYLADFQSGRLTQHPSNLLDESKYTKPFSLENKKDYFGIYGADLTIPIAKPLDLYFQFAMNHDPIEANDKHANTGWGMAPGLSLSLKEILNITLEYRHFQDHFKASWFNYNYNGKRAQVDPSKTGDANSDNDIITLDNTTEKSILKGVFGSLQADLWILEIMGSYEYLLMNNSPFASFEARAGLGKNLLQNLNKIETFKIKTAEAFYLKPIIDDTSKFFKANSSVIWGVNASVLLGGIMEFFYKYENSYKYNLEGKLESDVAFSVGTAAHF